MDKLPPELLDVIVDECEFASLKHLRLVDKRFHDVATPSVFEHFYMGYSQHHLEHLCRLAKSPLGKHVNRFTIHADLLPAWPERDWRGRIDVSTEYIPQVDHSLLHSDGTCSHCEGADGGCWECFYIYTPADRVHARLSHRDYSEEVLAAAWARYAAFRAEQMAWREDREGIAFKEHFAMLPNLVEASVKTATPFQGRTNEWPVWKALSKEMLVGPDDWMYYDGVDQTDASRHPGEGQAALSLLEAVAYRSQFAGTNQLSKLEIQTTHWRSYADLIGSTVSQGGDGRMHLTVPALRTRYQRLTTDAFKHLTDLKLNAPFDARSEGVVVSELVTFLRAAKQLKRLDLAYTDDGEREEEGDGPTLFNFYEAVGPGLEHLGLSVNVSPCFVDWLERQARTLRSLDLRDMVVGDAQKLLERIPRVLRLERVYLECVWGTSDTRPSEWPYACFMARGTDFDDPYEQDWRDYLLGRREETPKLMAEGEDEDGEGEEVAELSFDEQEIIDDWM